MNEKEKFTKFFVLHNHKYNSKQFDKNVIEAFSDEINKKFNNKKNYYVQTFIHNDTFEKFILFCKDQLSTINLKEIDIQELISLNKEFKYEKLQVFLNNLKKSEDKILEKLDHYLLNERDTLFQIPYGSIFRIFFNPYIIFHQHDKAYEFIKELVERTDNEEFYQLFSCLDFSSLSSSNKDELINHVHRYQCFLPRNNISYYKTFSQYLEKDFPLMKKQIETIFEQINKIQNEIMKLNNKFQNENENQRNYIKQINQQLEDYIQNEIMKLDNKFQNENENQRNYIKQINQQLEDNIQNKIMKSLKSHQKQSQNHTKNTVKIKSRTKSFQNMNEDIKKKNQQIRQRKERFNS